MLSGDGNKNSPKKLVGLMNKITALHVQHTFCAYFFAVVLHDFNFQKLPSYPFYAANVVCDPVHFFFSLPLIFTPWWPLVFLIFSPLL